MTVIGPLFYNGKALPKMNDVNLLRHNDALWHYQIFIFVKVINDPAPWLAHNMNMEIACF